MSLDAVFFTLKINAHEQHHVVCANVPNAYLHSLMDELVNMKITNTKVDILFTLQLSWKLSFEMNSKDKQALFF